MRGQPHDRESRALRQSTRDVVAEGSQPSPSPKRARRYFIGREQTPVVVCDDFLDQAQRLLDYAYSAHYEAPATNFFPGVRAPAPAAYVERIQRAVPPLIRSAFHLTSGRASVVSSDLSLITTPPERLAAAQRVPHTDRGDDHLFAVLHYLVPEGCFGTRFFRHRKTGYEQVTDERLAAYKAVVRDELARSDPQGYASQGDPLYEQTAEIEGRFNRLVIYPGWVLHSGAVPNGFAFDQDPRRGRLTANTFVRLQPPELLTPDPASNASV